MKNSNMPAMPFQEVTGMIGGAPTGYKNHKGLTKREMFAMAAMQGILSNSGGVIQANPMSGTGFCNSNPDSLASLSVECADALLVELERTSK